MSRKKICILYLFIILIFFGFSKNLYCQDSILIETELSTECEGQHNLAAIAKGGIPGLKQFNNTNLKITDNPIFHFAIYNGTILKTTLNKKYCIETGLFIEERSFSHGSNTLSNLILYPKLKLTAIDTFKIGNYKIHTFIKAGDFWNEDFQDFIRFYNIDFQALEANFGIKNWNFKTNVIGDLSKNIGLDLHEMYKFQVQNKYKKVLNSIALSINELFSAPFGYHPQKRDYNITYYSKYNINLKSSIEAQADFRINKTDNFSKAFGIKYAYQSINWIKFNTVLRYIDLAYNKGYSSFRPKYRNGNKFIGEQLYPLKNFYRSMNQWAFLTNFQNRDIFNLEFNCKMKFFFYKKISFFTDIDYNVIYEPILRKFTHFPLFNSGFNINFTENFIFTISVTNKQMNLDNFYQTFYISKIPLLSYNFKFLLDNLKLSSKKIKS